MVMDTVTCPVPPELWKRYEELEDLDKPIVFQLEYTKESGKLFSVGPFTVCLSWIYESRDAITHGIP